jgi:hypothetical protein
MEVCIYETTEVYKASMVMNILRKRKIRSFCKNMYIQNLHGDSKFLTGIDLIVGTIKIYVDKNKSGMARQIILNNHFFDDHYKTIENDKMEKDKYIILRLLMFSILSLFITPIFFNVTKLVFCFRNRILKPFLKYGILAINIVYFLFSISICITSKEYSIFIWKANILILSFFCINEYIEYDKKKSNIKYFFIIPIVLLILSFNIGYYIFNITIF